MKHLHYGFFIYCLWACGGSLSDEQRKKLHDGMEEQKIVKVTDAEIMSASIERGREVSAAIEKMGTDSNVLDSLQEIYRVKIRLIKPEASDAMKVEDQLIEAYVAGAESGAVNDNIQKLRTDSSQEYDTLLYTRPKISSLPDGAVNVEGIWNIYISRKEVIRSMAN
jgi:hypothetical protein